MAPVRVGYPDAYFRGLDIGAFTTIGSLVHIVML